MTASATAQFIEELAVWGGRELIESNALYTTMDGADADFVTSVATLAGYRTHVPDKLTSDHPAGAPIRVFVTRERRRSSAQRVSIDEMPASGCTASRCRPLLLQLRLVVCHGQGGGDRRPRLGFLRSLARGAVAV